MYRDGVVIMIVADLSFCLVQSPSYYIFRHVHTCCIRIFCLYGILAISPNVTSRVSEQQLLKAPQPVINNKRRVWQQDVKRFSFHCWFDLMGTQIPLTNCNSRVQNLVLPYINVTAFFVNTNTWTCTYNWRKASETLKENLKFNRIGIDGKELRSATPKVSTTNKPIGIKRWINQSSFS